MNYIKNIEIKNFKSIRHQKIDDCRRVNVFIGYPNVGKSNIFEAIGLFSLLNTQEGNEIEFNNIVRITELPQLFTNGDITSKINIQVNGFFNIAISHLEVGCFFEIYSTEKTKGVMPPIVPEKENHKQHIVVLNGHINNPSQLILGESRTVNRIDAKQFEPVRRYLFNSNHTTSTGISLNYLNAPFGNNISKIIFSIPVLKEEIIALLDQFGLSIAKSQPIKFIKRLKDGELFILDFQMIADTLQRLIFYKTAILSNRNAVLLFEEPEAHQFPPYISNLTSDIISDENNNQYFIATHSPFVLNDFMEDMDKDELSIYAVGLKDGETVIRRLTDEEITEVYQYGIDLFFNLEDYLKDAVS